MNYLKYVLVRQNIVLKDTYGCIFLEKQTGSLSTFFIIGNLCFFIQIQILLSFINYIKNTDKDKKK